MFANTWRPPNERNHCCHHGTRSSCCGALSSELAFVRFRHSCGCDVGSTDHTHWTHVDRFVTTQEAPGDDSSPPTPQPPAGAMLNSADFSKNTITPSEQARLEAVNSQYTMDNLQHLMQQQLAFFAPERQQGIIASVIEQRSIFVQARNPHASVNCVNVCMNVNSAQGA